MDDVERTLPASERRRAWAREQGYSARSAAFTAALSLMTAAALWLWAGAAVVDQLALRLETRLASRPLLTLDVDSAVDRVRGDAIALGFFALWGGCALWGAAAVANLIQTGFHWAPAAATPDVSRINPAAGLFRMISITNWITAGWTLLVVAAVAFGAVATLKSSVLSASGWTGSLEEVVRNASDDLALVALQLTGLVAALCLVDVARRRWTLAKSIRMTADEQREEAGRTPVTRRRPGNGG